MAFNFEQSAPDSNGVNQELTEDPGLQLVDNLVYGKPKYCNTANAMNPECQGRTPVGAGVPKSQLPYLPDETQRTPPQIILIPPHRPAEQPTPPGTITNPNLSPGTTVARDIAGHQAAQNSVDRRGQQTLGASFETLIGGTISLAAANAVKGVAALRIGSLKKGAAVGISTSSVEAAQTAEKTAEEAVRQVATTLKGQIDPIRQKVNQGIKDLEAETKEQLAKLTPEAKRERMLAGSVTKIQKLVEKYDGVIHTPGRPPIGMNQILGDGVRIPPFSSKDLVDAYKNGRISPWFRDKYGDELKEMRHSQDLLNQKGESGNRTAVIEKIEEEHNKILKDIRTSDPDYDKYQRTVKSFDLTARDRAEVTELNGRLQSLATLDRDAIAKDYKANFDVLKDNGKMTQADIDTLINGHERKELLEKGLTDPDSLTASESAKLQSSERTALANLKTAKANLVVTQAIAPDDSYFGLERMRNWQARNKMGYYGFGRFALGAIATFPVAYSGDGTPGDAFLIGGTTGVVSSLIPPFTGRWAGARWGASVIGIAWGLDAIKHQLWTNEPNKK